MRMSAVVFSVTIQSLRGRNTFHKVLHHFLYRVIFERFYGFFSASGSRAKRREEKRREERGKRRRVCSRGREDLKKKKKKSGKRKDNRSPLVCLSLLWFFSESFWRCENFWKESKQQIFFSSSLFAFRRTTKTEHTQKTHNTKRTNENETTYDANRRCRRR